jgi:hypothetical protein
MRPKPSGTGGKTPADKTKRKPIYNKTLGRIDEVPRAPLIDHPPIVESTAYVQSQQMLQKSPQTEAQ